MKVGMPATALNAFLQHSRLAKVDTWGERDYSGDRSKLQSELADVQYIYAAKAGAFAALTTDGTVVAWGNRNWGGDCSKVQSRLEDVRYMYSTNAALAALKADGSVVAWDNVGEGVLYTKKEIQEWEERPKETREEFEAGVAYWSQLLQQLKVIRCSGPLLHNYCLRST